MHQRQERRWFDTISLKPGYNRRMRLAEGVPIIGRSVLSGMPLAQCHPPATQALW